LGPILQYYKNLQNGSNIHDIVQKRKKEYHVKKKQKDRGISIKKKVKIDNSVGTVFNDSSSEQNHTRNVDQIQIPKGLEFGKAGSKMLRQNIKRREKHIPGTFRE
jgi:hypothetical protein